MNIEKIIEEIAERKANEVIDARIAELSTSTKANEIRERLAQINAEEFINVRQAAFLLNCSESKIRELIRNAKSGKSNNPIPYTALDTHTVFHRASLLSWAMLQRRLQVDKGE